MTIVDSLDTALCKLLARKWLRKTRRDIEKELKETRRRRQHNELERTLVRTGDHH